MIKYCSVNEVDIPINSLEFLNNDVHTYAIDKKA